MSRAVFVGGFGNGKRTAEGVGEALVKVGGYDDFTPFTFAYAMDNPGEVTKAVKGVDVFTHSAGMLAVRGSSPKELVSVGAPIPTSVPRLMLGTGKKTARMIGHSISGGAEARRATNRYNASSAAELTAHLLGNVKHLKTIARADAIAIAAVAQDSGIPTWLYYNEQDDYFKPTDKQRTLARIFGVQLQMLPGQHDQLALYPEDTLENIYNAHLGPSNNVE